MVPASDPSAAVGCGEQGVDLVRGQEGHLGTVVTLGGDGQHPLDELRVFGMTERGVAEQGVDRGESGVAGAGAVVPFVFEVVQERGDGGGVQVGSGPGRWEVSRCGRGRIAAAAGRCPGRRAWCAG